MSEAPPRASQIVSLRPASVAELPGLLERAAAAAPDGIEVRLDDIRPTAAELRATRDRCPLFLLGASRAAGREPILERAVDAGFDAIDLDHRSPLAAAPATRARCERHGARLIVSFHDDRAVPADRELDDLVERLGRHGLAKIAVTPAGDDDILRLAEAAGRWRDDGRPFILTAMGPLAAPARLLLALLGSAITYLALDANRATAPGQLTLERHRRIAGTGAPRARGAVLA